MYTHESLSGPMLQLRPNPTELRLMDYYHQFFCRFQRCKRKVPPPSLLSNDFEKSWVFFKILDKKSLYGRKNFITEKKKSLLKILIKNNFFQNHY